MNRVKIIAKTRKTHILFCGNIYLKLKLIVFSSNTCVSKNRSLRMILRLLKSLFCTLNSYFGQRVLKWINVYPHVPYSW